MMPFECRIECDSISAAGIRLTTFVVTFPRFILAEVNTHRMLCLAGDSELEFDLPAGQVGKYRRVHKMRLDTFVDRWHNGAAPRINKGGLGTNRQPARDRLAAMQIRQLDENTSLIRTSTVKDCFVSGTKEVFEVMAGRFKVACSRDHRVLTDEGWKAIGDLSLTDSLIVRHLGKREEDLLDPDRLRKIGGRWRSLWQRDVRAARMVEFSGCQQCGSCRELQIHHVVPVYQSPDLAFEESNVLLLCLDCHDAAHAVQGWQGGTYLFGDAEPITSIRYRGAEPTFDLEIAGEFANFLANGVVVHNSRNSASSRAIPVEKRIAQIEADPFIPEAFGSARKGMQAGADLVADEADAARIEWQDACADAIERARDLAKLGVHKQLANRLLEPFAWHTAVISATDWNNFFALRCHPDAQPEFRKIAEMMRDAYQTQTPKLLQCGQWHLPFVPTEDRSHYRVRDRLISAGRCARVSYLTHEGKRDPEADIALANRLIEAIPKHASPFEHQATPISFEEGPSRGNFRGWLQFRHLIPDESIPG